jgi:transposase
VSWVLEPTGRYSTGVARRAKEAGRTVLLAEPRQARSYLVSVSPRAKTDTLDAVGLALYGLSRPLAAYPVPSAAMDRLTQLLSARKSLSKEVSRLSQQAKQLPAAKDELLEACQATRKSLKVIDKKIAALLKEHGYTEVAARLMAVPGVGPITAASVIRHLSERRFASADKFVAYIGLDVTVQQSGKSQRAGRISHRGDAEMRRLFYLAAQSNLSARRETPFKAQYKREREKGLSSTQALCAVSRKIARLCWSLVKHNASYDPERVHWQKKGGSPPQVRQSAESGQA